MKASPRTANPTSMLKLVRYASRNADVATSKRDAAIREAHLAGASLRDRDRKWYLAHERQAHHRTRLIAPSGDP